MDKKQSMTSPKNHDLKRFKTSDKGDLAPWSDLNHDVLILVMMQLGVIDFVSFSGVCKSWRSLAVSNKTRFMASKPPMFIGISPLAYRDDCYLTDFEGRKFKTIIPHLVGRTCFGSTCGYLILYGIKDNDIWLVNPITRHELHFPNVPFSFPPFPVHIRAILVFSSSISGWVFVMVNRCDYRIWFSIAGKGAWNSVKCNTPIFDLHAFKGKIYTLINFSTTRQLSELRLNPQPKLTLLKTKNLPQTYLHLRMHLVSSDENIYLMKYDLEDEDPYIVHKVDFEEMKWVPCVKIGEEYAFFLSNYKPCAAIKQKVWADPSQYGRCAEFVKSEKGRFFTANMWYFPHACLNIDYLDE